MIEVKKIEYSDFDTLLNAMDLISPSREWRNFLSSRFGFLDHFLGIYQNQTLACIFPAYLTDNGLKGVPKLYTEPIYLNDTRKNFTLTEITDCLRAAKDFPRIRFDFCFILDDVLKNGKQLRPRGLAHILRVGERGEEEILQTLVSRKTRNQIKTAYQRGGFELVIGNDLDAFYAIYLKSIERLRSIAKAKDFFAELSNAFSDNFRILGAYRDNKLAGANLILLKNKYLYLPFNVSDSKYFTDYVNDFLYWETIKFGLQRGVKIFDFGPSTLTDKSHHHFKEGFGTIAVPIFRFTHHSSLKSRISDIFSTKTRNLALRLRKIL